MRGIEKFYLISSNDSYKMTKAIIVLNESVLNATIR